MYEKDLDQHLGMDKKISFHITRKDKVSIIALAKSSGLSISSFCRFVILKVLRESIVAEEEAKKD